MITPGAGQTFLLSHNPDVFPVAAASGAGYQFGTIAGPHPLAAVDIESLERHT